MAAEIVLALQLMVTRRVDAFDPAVVTIAQVVAGTTTNIIPETAFLGGTMRTVSEARRTAVRADVRRVCEGVAAAHGASVEVDIEPGYPVTVNDDAFAELVLSVAGEVVGEESARRLPAPIMGAEDFSYVLQQVPGAIGLRRRAAARRGSGHGPDEPLEPGGLRRVGDGRRDRDLCRRRAALPVRGLRSRPAQAGDRASRSSVSRRSAANRRRPISCTSRPISLPRALTAMRWKSTATWQPPSGREVTR